MFLCRIHSKSYKCTCGWSANSSLHIAQGCTESPCFMDLCFTLSHSSAVSGKEGGSTKPNFWATVKKKDIDNSTGLEFFFA